MAQAGWFENTQLLPQRGKSCSVSGFAHTKRGLSLSRKGTVPFLYTVPAQPSNGFLTTQPEPFISRICGCFLPPLFVFTLQRNVTIIRHNRNKLFIIAGCGSGGIGRRVSLRSLWSIRPCGFESHLPHQFNKEGALPDRPKEIDAFKKEHPSH